MEEDKYLASLQW